MTEFLRLFGVKMNPPFDTPHHTTPHHTPKQPMHTTPPMACPHDPYTPPWPADTRSKRKSTAPQDTTSMVKNPRAQADWLAGWLADTRERIQSVSQAFIQAAVYYAC